MRNHKIVISNKPLLTLLLSVLLLAGTIALRFRYWYIFGILFLINAIVFMIAPNRNTMSIDGDGIELYNEQNEPTDRIDFAQIVYWNYDGQLSGDITIVYNGGSKEPLVCTVRGFNNYLAYQVLNHRLRVKNYKLMQYNAPFEKVGDILHSHKERK
jgi:hypothetical protein